MTAKELYDCDPGFRGFITVWCADRRCPLELVDYLLDRDMPGPAECARWMHQGDQWDSWQDGVEKSGRFPWFIRGEWLMRTVDASGYTKDRAHRVPETELRDSWCEENITAPTAEGCLLKVMDRWRVPT